MFRGDSSTCVIQSKKQKKALKSIGVSRASKAWAFLKEGANGKKKQIYIFSPGLIVISTNNKYMDNEIEKNFGKVKFQLFSVASLENAH